MSDQPTYLKLLRGIANAESDAHCYLSAWRDTTTNPDVREVLTTVASREGEHGMAFAKRIIELGFEFERREDAKLPEKMTVARSDRSDKEKAEYFGLSNAETTLTYFDNVFKDHSIDIKTGELLGRYIAEEHDTARLAKTCYDALCAVAAAERPAESTVATLESPVDGHGRLGKLGIEPDAIARWPAVRSKCELPQALAAEPRPREIDIDVLLHGATRLDEPGLEIPHRMMWERLFVLEPLAELRPDLTGPDGRPIGEHVADLRQQQEGRSLGW